MFTRSGETWAEGQQLIGSGQVGESYLGAMLALSGDGDTALVGGAFDNGGAGAVWTLTRSGETWTQQGGKLTGGGESGEGLFGGSVSLSADTNTAMIGGPNDEPPPNGGHATTKGAAWVFTRAGEAWVQQSDKLTGLRGDLGSVVALSADGNTGLISAPQAKGESGVVEITTRSAGKWSRPKPFAAAGSGSGVSYFGNSLAFSGDGNTALVGEPRGSGNGHAWLYTAAPQIKKLSPRKGPLAGGTSVTITGSFLAGASGVDFGSTPAESFTVNSSTSITAVSPPGTGAVNVSVTTSVGTALSSKSFS